MNVLPTIEELNALPADAFAQTLAPLFEGARPLLLRLAGRRPFASDAELFVRAREVAANLSDEEKRAILDGHAPIGADPEAVRTRSAFSYREQGYDRQGAVADEEPTTAAPDAAGANVVAVYGVARARATPNAPRANVTEEAARSRMETVRAELEALNGTYREKFGFTFVVFVNRRPPEAIVPILRERLARSREEEMETALGEIVAIAADRARTLRGDRAE
jgi:2-oxo-4-hydroxy-4-carboxy--5-ureidoimidazoline (OHCU) decarboxylase